MAAILLAEDDDSLRVFLARGLGRAGHAVTAVGDGRAALDAVEAAGPGGFDLLLADVVMPGLDGIELARRLRAGAPELPVVLITGFAAVALAARHEGPAGARVLSKPFHLRTLVAEVDRLLAA